MQSPVPLLPLPRSRRISRRSRGGGATFPLTNVGEWFTAAIHCWQWEPKEPHFSRGREMVGPTNYSTPTTVQYRVASPTTRSSSSPVVPPSLQRQTLHRWGIVWCCTSGCLWCIISPTILVEATCFVSQGLALSLFLCVIHYTGYWR